MDLLARCVALAKKQQIWFNSSSRKVEDVISRKSVDSGNSKHIRERLPSTGICMGEAKRAHRKTSKFLQLLLLSRFPRVNVWQVYSPEVGSKCLSATPGVRSRTFVSVAHPAHTRPVPCSRARQVRTRTAVHPSSDMSFARRRYGLLSGYVGAPQACQQGLAADALKRRPKLDLCRDTLKPTSKDRRGPPTANALLVVSKD